MLHPGELSLTRKAGSIATILGSCVSFTMRHADSGMAAMCHCLLGTIPLGKPLSDGTSRFCYLDHAFEEMLDYFKREGIRPGQLEVKAFGGADVMKVLSSRRTVGQHNIESAQDLVSKQGIQLSACDLGGPVGRKIVFKTDTGSVMVRRLKPAHQ